MIRVLIITLAFSLVNACSSIPDVGVAYHVNFNFLQVKSYSLYHRNSPFTDSQNLTDIHRNAIEIAIERSMSEQKFSYIEPKKADLIVTYYWRNGNPREYAKYNNIVRFCEQCLRASTWKTTEQFSNITKGNLVLDLYAPNKKRSVWRSAYPLNIDIKDNSAELNKKIRQAVSLMLAQYPHHEKPPK